MMIEEDTMRGKIVLITGATAGIGEAAAVRLYAMGANVILHGRNPVRTAATLDRIVKTAADRPSGKLDILHADFSVLTQVYDMVEAFKRRYNHLDVLINNAGAFFMRRQESPDGLEMSFAVNYLAHFLLTTRLLDVLKSSAPARIINVSSDAHFQAKLDFSDLMLKNKYKGIDAYAKSKLYGLLFTYELARRFRRTPNLALTANAVHPGFVATELGKNNRGLVRLGLNVYQHTPILNRRVRKPDQGADTIVYLASDPDAGAFNGKYFFDREVKATSVPSYDHDAAAHLWGVSEMMVRQHVPALQPAPEKEAASQTGPSIQAAAASQAGAELAPVEAQSVQELQAQPPPANPGETHS